MVERPIDVPDGAEVARLRRGFHGQLLLPDQDGYHTTPGGSGTRWSTTSRR